MEDAEGGPKRGPRKTEDEPPAKALRTPRAAGVAGVLSALMLGATMVLVRQAIPAHPVSPSTWLADSSSHTALKVSLVLLPFGGITFLWFMGAVRDFVGGKEDRFFATVFLGAGLLYVGVLFVFGATASAFVLTIDRARDAAPPAAVWHYGRYLTVAILTQYAPRLAGVFTLATTTIGTRLGLLPRWLSLLGYAVRLVLLFLVSALIWPEILFPCWVLVVGVFLITHGVR